MNINQVNRKVMYSLAGITAIGAVAFAFFLVWLALNGTSYIIVGVTISIAVVLFLGLLVRLAWIKYKKVSDDIILKK